MSETLIKNALIVNEGKKFNSDVLIQNDIIIKISKNIIQRKDFKVIDATNKILIPGVIDDQVHFREPGLTHKATIETESRAAVAGGVTSFIEMPNTLPNTTTIKELERKFEIAEKKSYANFSFMFGGTNDNLEEIKKLINQHTPNTKPKTIFKEKSIPTYVATPLPPLNFNHTGNTWPIKAHKADIYTVSGKLIFTYKTGITAFKTSSISVE